jgi:MoxR-like ATPase
MLSMLRASQAYAAISGRDYVLPDDVKTLAEPVFSHRLVMRSGYGESAKAREAIERIVSSLPVPSEDVNAERI